MLKKNKHDLFIERIWGSIYKARGLLGSCSLPDHTLFHFFAACYGLFWIRQLGPRAVESLTPQGLT
jgi:hypothetical protein